MNMNMPYFPLARHRMNGLSASENWCSSKNVIYQNQINFFGDKKFVSEEGLKGRKMSGALFESNQAC